MAFVFRDPVQFWRETLAVTGGAVLAGVVAAAIGPAQIPLEALAGAGAMLGGAVGAALTQRAPRNPLARAALGVLAGAVTGVCFAIVGRVPLSPEHIIGGLAGGGAIAAALSTDVVKRSGALLLGVGASAAVGGAGALAMTKVAAYTASEGVPSLVSAAALAGAFGLWVAAAAGLRRFERVRDALLVKASVVLETLADPVRSKVVDAVAAYGEIDVAIHKDDALEASLVEETVKQSRALLDALLETAKSWQQIHADMTSPRLAKLDEKLADIEKRAAESNDAMTVTHLTRAASALRAQKSALDGLAVGRARAEAALDSQLALLERLRLAVAQHKVSDRERFTVELAAVGDQVSQLSADLESLSAAIAEAEAFSDRKFLADLERAGRRALATLEGVGDDVKAESAARTETTVASTIDAEVEVVARK